MNNSFRLDFQKSKFDLSVNSPFKGWAHIRVIDLAGARNRERQTMIGGRGDLVRIKIWEITENQF